MAEEHICQPPSMASNPPHEWVCPTDKKRWIRNGNVWGTAKQWAESSAAEDKRQKAAERK